MNAKSKAEVVAIIREYENALRALGVRRIGLFGSFAREEATSESDVDLLVEFEAGQKTFLNFVNLGFLLEEALGRKVELVTRESLSPYAGPEILAEVEYVSAPA